MLIWLFLILSCSAAHASENVDDFRLFITEDISLTIPSDWEEIPRHVLIEYEKRLKDSRGSERSLSCDFGFQTISSERWFEYPFVIVSTDSSGPITSDELLSMKRVDEAIGRKLKNNTVDFDEFLSAVSQDTPAFDSVNSIVWNCTRFSSAENVPVRGIIGMKFTQRGFIALSCFSVESQFANYSDQFREIIVSVDLGPASTYHFDEMRGEITGADSMTWGSFFECILLGFRPLKYWETYIATLLYLLIVWIPIFLLAILPDNMKILGCLGSLVLPIFQLAGLLLLVLSLWPIILGVGPSAEWSFAWQFLVGHSWLFVKLVGLLAIIAIGASLIPIIGTSSTLYTFLTGAAAIAIVTQAVAAVHPELSTRGLDEWPGFWWSVAFVGIAAVLTGLSSMLTAIIATLISERVGGTAESAGEWTMIFVGSLIGLYPMFVYGAFIGRQLAGTP